MPDQLYRLTFEFKASDDESARRIAERLEDIVHEGIAAPSVIPVAFEKQEFFFSALEIRK